MQQIFQNGRRRLRRQKAIPKTASEALLAVKNKIKSPCELTLAAAIMMKGRKYISSHTKKSFQRWPT